jgi:formylglycine-generating enzyme required for sulfatase activity
MSNETRTLRPGAFVDDLQVNAILGSGARDVTYLVSDPAIGTRFALKEYLPARLVVRQADGRLTPRDESCDQRFRDGLEKFRREARTIAALEHPNIVKVLRYFEANGTAYYLMPFYEGKTLDALVDSNGTLNREDSKALLRGLMEGLEYIHARGLIHQNIHPANIIVTGKMQPIVLDFRLAAADPSGPVALPREARSAYSAPEQLRPNGEIGPWTDIYAVAACMYRCVTGRAPLPASEREAELAGADTEAMAPFSGLAPAGLYGGLSDVVEQGLKLRVSDRPHDVGQWKKSYESLDWHRSVVVAGSGDGYAQEKREWLPIVLLGILVITLLGIGIVLMTDWSPEKFPVTYETEEQPQTTAVQQQPGPQQPAAEELKRWQGALQADTIEGYRRFIADYPESIYRDQANIQLEILDEKQWQTLAAEDNVPAYEHYLALFPDGLHAAAALQRIEAIQQAEAKRERDRLERERQEQLAWEEASNTRTIAAFDSYIARWPSGAHIEEARRIRRLLQDQSDDDKAFESALKLNTRDAFKAYINAFPRGANVAAALQHIDDLTLRPGKVFRDCDVCPSMTVIPADAYWQGSDDSSALALGMEKPRRLVTIGKPFAAGTYEITMQQWDACAADGGCGTRPADNGWGRGNRPVIMVSWNDAEEYVHWISKKTGQTYRLPSESEWEYFARAGEQSEWPGGDAAAVCQYGNIAGAETGFQWQHEACGDQLPLGTAPAGTFKPNAFGLYDTTGNVAEWTADCMNLSYLDAPVDGSAWGRGICSSHMTRGGSWITGSKEIRLPARFNLKNGDRNDFTGFRVVRDINE